MREQALSLWERHKENLVRRIGQMVGLLFEKLAAKQLPAWVGTIAEAQMDLQSGGLQLAPFPTTTRFR